ncbi:SurA N-terminal domain-containing protein, partial [Vibrio alfacsensis]
DIIQEQILDKLILEKLQLQEADRIGVRIDDNRLESTLNDIAKNNNQTIEQLRQTVREEGLTWEAFREQIRDEIAASEARNAMVR